jgi:Protein of unknown function (DUF5672)
MTIRAVIIEPREHAALAAVVHNIATKTSFPITIVHGRLNGALARKIAADVPLVDVLAEMNAENLTIDAFSRVCLDPVLWDNIGAGAGDKVLIFQTDSGICGDIHAPHVQVALRSDYCGAVFPMTRDIVLPRRLGPIVLPVGSAIVGVVLSSIVIRHKASSLYTAFMGAMLGLAVVGVIVLGVSMRLDSRGWVGNGGFSVRDWSMARKHAAQFTHNRTDWRRVPYEDIVFTRMCHNDPHCHVCDYDVAHNFSTEATANPKAFAFHKNWRYHPEKMMCDFNRWVAANQGVAPGSRVGEAAQSNWVPDVKIVWRRSLEASPVIINK